MTKFECKLCKFNTISRREIRNHIAEHRKKGQAKYTKKRGVEVSKADFYR